MMRASRLLFLLDKPTQFDGPFFRHVATRADSSIAVLYLSAASGNAVYDPELRCTIDWGLDLGSGYLSKHAPRSGWLHWLWSEVRAEHCDCLIVNGYNRPAYIAAAMIATLRGIRVCVRIDSVMFNQAGALKRAAKRAAYVLLRLLYHRFLATGTLAVEHLRHFGIPERKIGLFPYTVDTEYFANAASAAWATRDELRRRWGIEPGARTVLAVAKFNRREAPWDLLRAAQNLDAEHHVVLVLAGDGPERQALEAFARERIRVPVLFLGYVPYTQLPSLYACADVFVHAAADERWGVSVHEAIAAGLPVVASSRVGAAYDLIVAGENGYVYAAGEPAALHDALQRVWRLDAATVRRASARVLERWSYDGSWQRLREVTQ